MYFIKCNVSGEKREDGKIKFLFALFNKIGFAP